MPPASAPGTPLLMFAHSRISASAACHTAYGTSGVPPHYLHPACYHAIKGKSALRCLLNRCGAHWCLLNKCDAHLVHLLVVNLASWKLKIQTRNPVLQHQHHITASYGITTHHITVSHHIIHITLSASRIPPHYLGTRRQADAHVRACTQTRAGEEKSICFYACMHVHARTCI